jgi:hypothetical protein
VTDRQFEQLKSPPPNPWAFDEKKSASVASELTGRLQVPKTATNATKYAKKQEFHQKGVMIFGQKIFRNRQHNFFRDVNDKTV